MDEQFFIYWEDAEWCHRMRDHGWQVLVEPAASVVHHRGRVGGARSASSRRRTATRSTTTATSTGCGA